MLILDLFRDFPANHPAHSIVSMLRSVSSTAQEYVHRDMPHWTGASVCTLVHTRHHVSCHASSWLSPSLYVEIRSAALKRPYPCVGIMMHVRAVRARELANDLGEPLARIY